MSWQKFKTTITMKLTITTILLFIASITFGQTYKSIVAEADAFYNNKEYKKSVEKYKEAFKLEQKSGKDFCLIYLSTVEKAAYFWMSTDKGRSGQGDLFFDGIQELNPDVLARPLWEEVVAADGGGAGAAFLWIGISGLWAAPPAWPFLVLEVGFNAAASSMFTYLNGIS
jgi:hypothetical protein